MNQPDRLRLIADLGGTNLRIAVVRPGQRPDDIRRFRNDEFPSLAAALQTFLNQLEPDRRPSEAALAVAAPVAGDRVVLTNRNWSFSVEELKATLGLSSLAVLNDLEAAALAVPVLEAGDLRQIGEGTPMARAPAALIGPGTGLGVAALAWCGEVPLPLAGEGGHAGFAPANADQLVVLQWLTARYGRTSNERLISGPGLVNIHAALAQRDGLDPSPGLTPETLIEAGRAGDPKALQAIRLFLDVLAGVAGDLALILGARGGIYLLGSLLRHLAPLLDPESFRQGFIGKGRLKPYLAPIPTYLVVTSSIALIGLARLPELHVPGIGGRTEAIPTAKV